MVDGISLVTFGDDTIVDIIVQPRAARAGIVGLHDGALRLRVTAPPVDGEANAAVAKLLGELLDIPKSRIEIVGGRSGRRKRVRIHGMNARTINARIAPHLPPS